MSAMFHDLVDLAKANGFESVTDAITYAQESRVEIEELRKDLKLATDIIEQQLGEIERWKTILDNYERARLWRGATAIAAKPGPT